MQTDVIGHRLKLQHLKIVMVVAEWGSMQKAAKHLAISQPVVSKTIAGLEDVLGALRKRQVLVRSSSPDGDDSRLTTLSYTNPAFQRSDGR